MTFREGLGGLGCFAALVGMIGGIVYLTIFDERKYKERELRNEAFIDKIYEIAAGNDGIINAQERRDLVRELGIAQTIDESEILCLRIDSFNRISYHLGAGYVAAGKFSHYIDRKSGFIPKEEGEKYISKHSHK